MSNFIDAVKAGVEAAKEEFRPGHFLAATLPVRCSHCAHEEFSHRHYPGGPVRAPLANALVCTRCGLVHIFEKSTERIHREG